jgi:hypothetical protein
MNKENIPESGIEFSERQETFRGYILNLEKSVEWYNNICGNCSDVELNLIQAEVDIIDNLIERGCTELTWNSESIFNLSP